GQHRSTSLPRRDRRELRALRAREPIRDRAALRAHAAGPGAFEADGEGVEAVAAPAEPDRREGRRRVARGARDALAARGARDAVALVGAHGAVGREDADP